MDLRILVILALIQGITEFLPVSSSGHLALFPTLTGASDQGVEMDVAVHVGTLFAVIIYFWSDVMIALKGGIDILRGRFATDAARLAWLLALATVPVIIAGAVLKLTGLSDEMRNIHVIGWAMLIFGIILYIADTRYPVTKKAGDWSLKDALIMGMWQAIALIPGTSRSGATITAARFLGYDRRDGAKLAMLMSIPTIIASGVVVGLDVSLSDPGLFRDLAIAAALSFVAALAALAIMMRLLNSVSFTPYVIYRVALGVILLVIAYAPSA